MLRCSEDLAGERCVYVPLPRFSHPLLSSCGSPGVPLDAVLAADLLASGYHLRSVMMVSRGFFRSHCMCPLVVTLVVSGYHLSLDDVFQMFSEVPMTVLWLWILLLLIITTV